MSFILSHSILFINLILFPQNEELKLAPIKEPEPIYFSFETIGWKIMAIIAFFLMIIFTYKWMQHYKKNAYRRVAINQLSSINIESNKNINKIAILLKSVAITAYGRKEVAALYGDEWLLFLESKGQNTSFTKYSEPFLAIQNNNQNINTATKKEILSLTKKWIQTHA
ncbi:MAG: DUF4381 domain-containing protein [Flavobacteriaceae bacterium]|nr:DUF4381 domain-containing protein [Flavobacteriaceae bacterium]